jgi:hypothetical protein
MSKHSELVEVLDAAAAAHGRWIFLLLSAARSGSGADPDLVQRDNVCAVGRWIYGQGMSDWGTSNCFQDFKARHADFHSVAARTLREVLRSNSTATQLILSSSSEFRVASNAFIDTIVTWSLSEA